jgi:hypothetical protein
MASRAAEEEAKVRAARRSAFFKSAPKITKRGFSSDWARLQLFVAETETTEEEATRWLPHVLEDSLFLLYEEAKKRLKIATLEDAKKLLSSLVGVERRTFDDFSRRKWLEGSETVSEYACVLSNLASQLSIPEGMVCSQFLSGLPEGIADEIRVRQDEDNPSIQHMVTVTEKLLKCRPKVNAVLQLQGANEELQAQLKKLTEEVAALRHSPPNGKNRNCYKCGKSGHVAANCRQGKCYSCGGVGHRSAHCSKNGFRPVERPARY